MILGCSEDELSEPWQLDRTRILAVRPTVQGDPDIVLGTRAEGRPGETLSFEALTCTPDDEPIGGVMWIACLDERAKRWSATWTIPTGKTKTTWISTRSPASSALSPSPPSYPSRRALATTFPRRSGKTSRPW